MARRKQTNRQRKIECPMCGCIIRMSRSAMQKHGVPTCACGEPMLPACVEDAALCGEHVLTRHPDFRAHEARWARRAIREHRRGGAGNGLRCGGCSRFIRATNTVCDCGFGNDIRGRRNHGGYVEAGVVASLRDADLPF